METITFTCKVITPMFLAGADGQTPELRAPSIKGAMRFWWRAINGHLVKEKDGRWDYTELKKREGELFGGTGDQASRCPFSMQLIEGDREVSSLMPLVPHDSRKGKQDGFSVGQRFMVNIRGNTDMVGFMEAMFPLVAVLGGVGKRSRRGMGAFAIEKVEKNNKEIINCYPTDLTGILELVKSVVEDSGVYFSIEGQSIRNKLARTPDFPFLVSIELGRKDTRILERISKATHEVKEKDFRSYEASMGHATQGRFASPVYVSVLEGYFPVISTLNTVPGGGHDYKINRNLQSDFKQKIL